MNYSNKQAKIYLTILLIFILSVGCGEDGNTGPVPLSSREVEIVGTWALTKMTITDQNGIREINLEDIHYSMTILTKEDRTLTMTINSNGQESVQSGKWNVNNDYLIINFGGNDILIPYPAEEKKFTLTFNQQEDNNTITQVLEFTKQ